MSTAYDSLIIRMGAVLINGDYDTGSFSSCRCLTCTDRKSGKVYDWKPEFEASVGEAR